MALNRKQKKIIAAGLLSVLALLVVARIALPFVVTDYVNRVINRIDGYSGSVSDVDIHLYRGAYTIHNLKIFKEQGNIPVPFIDIAVLDFSVEWGALFDGAIVGEASMNTPKLNFATARSGASQTGTDTDWTRPIKDLMPLDINRVDISNGVIAYKDFSASRPVDLSITDLNGTVFNLRNVEDKNLSLPSHFEGSGKSIGGGELRIVGDTNILKETPDFDIDAKLEGVSLPAINNYSNDFAGIDFVEGTLHIYTELAVKDGMVTGYVKPLARNITLVDSEQDTDPFNYLWETFASIVVEVFENQPADQFATRIELEGNLNNPQTDFWSTLAGIVNNAFVRAFSEGTEGTVNFQSTEG